LTSSLADYVSLDDDLCIEEVVKRTYEFVEDKRARRARSPLFGLIVDSIARLVVRQWLIRYNLDGKG
jgi:hypothetical protein